MDNKRAAQLISDNLTAIYGYAFARLYDKDKVEDLAAEIVCEILASAPKLKSEEAFWAFAWKIAENTFRKFIKREEIKRKVEQLPDEPDIGVYAASPEKECIEEETRNERIYLLRRELSLLTKTHREVCVAYYVDNKSCSEIAREQNISVEMVKYHLFKTRKLLKEGIGMTRELGEKSYNPGTFRLDFWGDRNKYATLFERKLPGAIMLAAYDVPMTANELSIELGVAMPYLEDELQTLEAAGVLMKVGAKYQTNLVIITDAYEKDFVRKTSHVYEDTANEIFDKAVALLPQIRRLEFRGNNYDDNRLLFMALNMAMVKGYQTAHERMPSVTAPKLPLGGCGWIFGYDNDYVNHHFIGVTMETWNKAGTAWFSAENYIAIRACQVYDHSKFCEKAEAMCAAILNEEPDKSNETLPWLIEHGFVRCTDGRLSANYPVFSAAVYEQLLHLLTPISELVAECVIEITDKAARILTDVAPAAVKGQCATIARIHHGLDVMAFLMESLIDSGKLIVPTENTPLCVYGVRK